MGARLKKKDLNLDSPYENIRKYQLNYMSKSKRKNIGIDRDFFESMKKSVDLNLTH